MGAPCQRGGRRRRRWQDLPPALTRMWLYRPYQLYNHMVQLKALQSRAHLSRSMSPGIPLPLFRALCTLCEAGIGWREAVSAIPVIRPRKSEADEVAESHRFGSSSPRSVAALALPSQARHHADRDQQQVRRAGQPGGRGALMGPVDARSALQSSWHAAHQFRCRPVGRSALSGAHDPQPRHSSPHPLPCLFCACRAFVAGQAVRAGEFVDCWGGPQTAARAAASTCSPAVAGNGTAAWPACELN